MSDYEAQTKTELQDEVDSRGLEVPAGASKTDLIAALEADDADDTEATTDDADFATSGTVQTVDIADLSQEPLEGEHVLLTGESWIILGEDESVPEWAVGMPAAVISAPVATERDDNGTVLYEYTPEDAIVTVRERTQGATLSVPLSSAQKVSIHGGRTAVVNFP